MDESLKAHLCDLEEKSKLWHKSLASRFLNEEELAEVKKLFASSCVRYDGGYENARKKKVIFLRDEEDDFSDIVCLKAKIDQRFRKIGHRDILGALMNLQIDRGSFGDFWVEDDTIYLYTSIGMDTFLIDHLTRINQLSIQFEKSDIHPAQEFHYEVQEYVLPSLRYDAIVAKLAHCSRQDAHDMISKGLVMIDHVLLEDNSDLCNNNVTISIRGIGRFFFDGIVRETRSGNVVGRFLKSI